MEKRLWQNGESAERRATRHDIEGATTSEKEKDFQVKNRTKKTRV